MPTSLGPSSEGLTTGRRRMRCRDMVAAMFASEAAGSTVINSRVIHMLTNMGAPRVSRARQRTCFTRILRELCQRSPVGRH